MFKQIAAVSALVGLTVGSAMAAVPTEVSAAISTGKTDALEIGALVLAAIIAIFALKLARRAL